MRDGKPDKAIQLFQHVQREGMNLDKFTFVWVINACVGLGSSEDGRHVHG